MPHKASDLGTRDKLFYEVARDMSSSLELDVVLRNVMDKVITLMKEIGRASCRERVSYSV